MISIRLVGKDKKIVGIVDDNTPVPHTLARITEVSTNYGLADEARRMYPELMKKNKGDWPGAVFDREKKTEKAKAVAGPYKEKETDEDIIVNIADYVEPVPSEETEAPKTTEVFNPQAHAAALAAASSSHKKIIKGLASGGVGAKANGYCMFIKHIARKKNATGSLSELMVKFDKDWKMLPDHEKAEWKIRAKSGYVGRPGSSQSQAGGRGLQEREERVGAPVAPLAGAGRGRGRGRGRVIPAQIVHDESDDSDFY